MANRLTDTGKWSKVWFRKLEPKWKLLWLFMLDNCDAAGVWEMDLELASIYIGEKLDPVEALAIFKEHIGVIHGGKRWLILDFVTFQYKVGSIDKLNRNNKAHLGVIRLIERHGEEYRGALKGLRRGLEEPSKELRNRKRSRSRNRKRTEDEKAKNNLEESAVAIYEFYAERVRSGARQDSIRNIEHRLKEHTPEDLRGAIERYIKNGMQSDSQYRFQCNNFFGRATHFKDYLEGESTKNSRSPKEPEMTAAERFAKGVE